MSSSFIKAEEVNFTYKSQIEGRKDVQALKGINTSVKAGEFLVILGRNGSGKSTFSRLLNSLIRPTSGDVYIKGINTKDDKQVWEIRRMSGMVFQNPDNQIVGTVVEEDVAFGPENIGIEPAEIRKRVDEALKAVGIYEYRDNAPHLLSGGQKQRVAIAGILAMKPECIILDEATSMLDPVGRKEVIQILRKLNKEEKITIIHITHHMDEAVAADRVIVIDKGEVVLEGTPKQVFGDVERIKKLGLDVPQVTELLFELRKEGIDTPSDIIDIDSAIKFLSSKLGDN